MPHNIISKISDEVQVIVIGLMSWLGMGVANSSKRNNMLAGYLSDMAVATIGEGNLLDVSHDYKVSGTFDKIKVHSYELDDLFIKPLKAVFYDYATPNYSLIKYDRLLYHFESSRKRILTL